MNLDGGGSSCLVVNGKIVNKPSDPVPRPVANAFMIYKEWIILFIIKMNPNIETKINQEGLKTNYSLEKFLEVCNDHNEEAKIVKFIT